MRAAAFWCLVLSLGLAACFASQRRAPTIDLTTSRPYAGGMSTEAAPAPQLPVIGPGLALGGTSSIRLQVATQIGAAIGTLARLAAIAPASSASARRAPPARTLPLRI